MVSSVYLCISIIFKHISQAKHLWIWDEQIFDTFKIQEVDAKKSIGFFFQNLFSSLEETAPEIHKIFW